jgi:hypothetical protein
VLLRVLEVEGNGHAVVEGHLDRHAPAEDPLVHGAEMRQRPHLEGGVLEGGVGDDRQVVVLLARAAAEEGGGAEGGPVRRAAADHLKAEHVVVELAKRSRVARAKEQAANNFPI